MAVPASGAITLGKIGKEIRATNTGNNYDNGPHTSSQTALGTASTGGHGTISQFNPAANRPDQSAPHAMSEWYSYNHLLGH